MRRKLGKFETATAISNEKQVFNIVGVVFMERPPGQEIVRQALDILQRRHPFINVRIVKSGRRYFFESGEIPEIPFEVLNRETGEHWMGIVEQCLNQKLDSRRGPLVQCAYLTDGIKHGEIILTFSHSIVDGPSVINIFNELLKICASLDSDEQVEKGPLLAPLPPVEDSFPPAYQGLGLALKTMIYALRQMGSELRYQFLSRKYQKKTINQDARGRILPMRVSKADTREIVVRARKERVTLYSVLQAAMLQSIQKLLYDGEQMSFRYLVPGDLRPYLEPPTSRENMGCYVSMMRFMLPLHSNDDLWSLARVINKQIYTATKSGEKYLASVTAEQVMRMLFALNKFRMCNIAITYSGAIQLDEFYGAIRVKGLRGFTSNFGQGPEYSAQVSITNDELWWDIVYLDQDMDHALALRIADQIKTNLINACQ